MTFYLDFKGTKQPPLNEGLKHVKLADSAIVQAKHNEAALQKDLHNITLWRQILLDSGASISEVTIPNEFDLLLTSNNPMERAQLFTKYHLERRTSILYQLSASQIIRYCSALRLKMHGRLIPKDIQ